jgi:hypothetical protein
MTMMGQYIERIPDQLTLENALSLLVNNPALKAQIIEIEVEEGDVINADKNPNPEFSFSSEGFVFDRDRGSFWNRLQPSITLRQEFLTGKRKDKRVSIEKADAEKESRPLRKDL